MTKFTINAESVKRLLTLSSQSKEVISLTKTIFCPSAQQLSVNLYSARTALSFATDISNYSSDDTEELNYFTLGIDDFTNTLMTVSDSCSNEVIVTIDKANSKATFESPVNGTKISKAIFNTVVSMEDAKASVSAVDDMKSSNLENPIEVTITNEVIGFYESANKFMNLTKTQNTIAVNQDRVFYADSLIVLEKHLSKICSNAEVYLKKQLLDSVKMFLKLVPELKVYLTSDFNMAYFEAPDIGYKAFFTLEEARYMYPTDEEIASLIPTEDCRVKVSLTKDELHNAFVPFNSTFKASGDSWNWKATNLNSNAENLEKGKLVLTHSDFTGSAESIVNVKVLENSEKANESDIIISIQCLEELLSLIPEDDITITYNSLTPNQEHGVGLYIESDTVKAVSVKFRS